MTKPVHASDISQERVDETAKRKHEPVEYTGNGTAGRENMTAPTGHLFQMPKREWIGLTDEEFEEYAHWIYPEKLIELENLLKEKNT